MTLECVGRRFRQDSLFCCRREVSATVRVSIVVITNYSGPVGEACWEDIFRRVLVNYTLCIRLRFQDVPF